MDATTVAFALAKEIFEVAVANRAGRVIDRKRLTRRQFERFVDALEVGTEVVMEACGTAHYWGRRGQARDLRVRLLPVQDVRPYVRRNKTDRPDTAVAASSRFRSPSRTCSGWRCRACSTRSAHSRRGVGPAPSQADNTVDP